VSGSDGAGFPNGTLVGEALTLSCWLPWLTAGGSCGGLVGMLQCLMTAAEVALGAPVVRPGNDLGNSMSIRPGMVASGRGRSQSRMAVKAKKADSWLFLTVTRREKAGGSRIRVAPSPPRGTSLAEGAPEGGGRGGGGGGPCGTMLHRHALPVFGNHV